jgi:hypothetical protein
METGRTVTSFTIRQLNAGPVATSRLRSGSAAPVNRVPAPGGVSRIAGEAARRRRTQIIVDTVERVLARLSIKP